MVAQDTVATFNNDKKQFKVNVDINYCLPDKWNKPVKVDDITTLKIYVNEKDSFVARNLNIFTNYVLAFYNASAIDKWRNSCNMSFYQNQLNFAIWCSTAGCGVSSEHLKLQHNLLSSVYKFHVYYQVRKILQQMSCPIPGESLFNSSDNHINMIAYKKLCNEFNVSANSDFRFKGGDNGGLGTMYNYATHVGYVPLKGYIYNPSRFQFIDQTTREVVKIDYVTQCNAIDGWKQFILEKSQGFTRAGAVRIDDSIRTYVYCILGSQAQTRSDIINSLECQQNFVDLLESSVKSLFSIPEGIQKYQDAIANTNARINYAVGIGLYMIPADLVLKVGVIQKYNNNIIIADDSVEIGENEDLNRPTTAKSQVSTVPVEETIVEEEEPAEVKTSSRPSIETGIVVSVVTFMLLFVFFSR